MTIYNAGTHGAERSCLVVCKPTSTVVNLSQIRYNLKLTGEIKKGIGCKCKHFNYGSFPSFKQTYCVVSKRETLDTYCSFI